MHCCHYNNYTLKHMLHYCPSAFNHTSRDFNQNILYNTWRNFCPVHATSHWRATHCDNIISNPYNSPLDFTNHYAGCTGAWMSTELAQSHVRLSRGRLIWMENAVVSNKRKEIPGLCWRWLSAVMWKLVLLFLSRPGLVFIKGYLSHWRGSCENIIAGCFKPFGATLSSWFNSDMLFCCYLIAFQSSICPFLRHYTLDLG